MFQVVVLRGQLSKPPARLQLGFKLVITARMCIDTNGPKAVQSWRRLEPRLFLPSAKSAIQSLEHELYMRVGKGYCFPDRSLLSHLFVQLSIINHGVCKSVKVSQHDMVV